MPHLEIKQHPKLKQSPPVPEIWDTNAVKVHNKGAQRAWGSAESLNTLQNLCSTVQIFLFIYFSLSLN